MLNARNCGEYKSLPYHKPMECDESAGKMYSNLDIVMKTQMHHSVPGNRNYFTKLYLYYDKNHTPDTWDIWGCTSDSTGYFFWSYFGEKCQYPEKKQRFQPVNHGLCRCWDW